MPLRYHLILIYIDTMRSKHEFITYYYYGKVSVDWDAINAKKQKEKEDEAARPQGGPSLGRSGRK